MAWHGYAGEILEVDLNTKKVSKRSVDENTARAFIGGRGFIAKLLYEELPEGVDPLSPENPLIFSVGPLTGTAAPTSGRFSVGCKSPLTGIYGIGNAGGVWGAQLKWAGYDGLVFKSKASEPVYLLIDDDEIIFFPANHLWGKTVSQTVDAIRLEQGDHNLSVCCIGPAGENLVPLSTIMTDRVRSAGRGGLGAVMGSKNLKAIAVRGSKPVHIHNPERFMELSRSLIQKAVEKGIAKSRWENGAYGAFIRWNNMGAILTRNGQMSQFDRAENISGQVFNHNHRLGTRGCFGCSIPCWTTYQIRSGPLEGKISEEVTTTTLKELGARCGLGDMDMVLTAHTYLNEYGLDAISVPAAISFAMECYQRGLLSLKQTGGMELTWGNGETILELIHQIANKRELGVEVGLGVRECSQRWGESTQPYALHVKGMEVVGTDPRSLPSWGLGYATSTRGACHMKAYSTFEYGRLSGEEMIRIGSSVDIGDRFGDAPGKGRAVAFLENLRAVGDSLEVCHFLTSGSLGFPEVLAPLLEAATGLEFSPEEVFQAGERIYNLERLFNLREGVGRSEDTLPARFLSEPISVGPAAGRTFQLITALEDYYEYRGWDLETGYPTDGKLRELGLEEMLRD